MRGIIAILIVELITFPGLTQDLDLQFEHGLSLSYHIMKAHGGELSVDHTPEGTRFTFSILLE